MPPDRIRSSAAVSLGAWGLAAALGCSSFVERQGAETTLRIVEAAQVAAARESDVELARDAMPAGLLQLAGFAIAYPDRPELAAMHADALCQYAVAFLFDDWEAATLGARTDEAARVRLRLDRLLARCVETNLAVLPARYRAARQAGQRAMIDALDEARVADVPALLWIATADATALAIEPLRHFGELPTMLAVLATCARLAPGFRDAAAEAWRGVLLAGSSQVLGGDDGTAQFAEARRLAGERGLLVEVLFARGVAVAKRDRELFRATLEQVVATDLSRWPSHRLVNELAVRKARRYLTAEEALLP